jgi:hypothetical protein
MASPMTYPTHPNRLGCVKCGDALRLIACLISLVSYASQSSRRNQDLALLIHPISHVDIAQVGAMIESILGVGQRILRFVIFDK